MPAPSTTTASTWGPPLWDVLFSVAFHHEPENEADVKELFTLLLPVLPCKSCQKSYKQILKTNSLQKATTKDQGLAKWLWTSKDMVNQKLGKQYCSFPDVRERYTYFVPLTSENIVKRIIKIMMSADHVEGLDVCAFSNALGRCGKSILNLNFCQSLTNVTTVEELIECTSV